MSNLPWLFSARVDLLTFAGSALVALGLLVVGEVTGAWRDDTPDWVWVSAILMIDVAHVYATGFRVFFDRAELCRRPWLYGLTPVFAFVGAWVVHGQGAEVFWRVLAYLAVFHFIRQQYGWIALYRARAGERDRAGWWVDSLAIYAATLYPLTYWHCHLPRGFHWFVEGDFLRAPASIDRYALPLYCAALIAYGARAVHRALVQGRLNPGKDVVLVTTAICWYAGIVATNSDYAFTVTNVIIHGVPYLVLVHGYRIRAADEVPSARRPRWASYLATVWILAYAEELLWDVGVWHERSWLFGESWSTSVYMKGLVPLLAVPQITHYVLDGFIWKRRVNRYF